MSLGLLILSVQYGLRSMGGFAPLRRVLSSGSDLRKLQEVESVLLELQETLEAGLVPERDRWRRLECLPPPWGTLSSACLADLRSQGASLLPTLKRLRDLAAEHGKGLRDARSRSAQALMQAGVCALLVPALGAALHVLLPGVSDQSVHWALGCCLALAVTGGGALWMALIAEKASWGGLDEAVRPWMLAALCAGERFLALVRAGNPADIAWVGCCDYLAREVDGLASRWGHSIWEEAAPGSLASRLAGTSGVGAMNIIVEAGSAIRRSVQVSLMEGKPCSERVETALSALRRDLRAQVSLEIERVGTRALIPLFVCVAPSLLGLLAWGLYLCWRFNAVG